MTGRAGKDVGKEPLIHCWWDYSIAQPLWKSAWGFQKAEIVPIVWPSYVTPVYIPRLQVNIQKLRKGTYISINTFLDNDSVLHIHCEVLFCYIKKKCDYDILRRMDGTENPYVMWNKSNSRRQIPHVFSHLWSLDLNVQVLGWEDGSADSAVDALSWGPEFKFQNLH